MTEVNVFWLPPTREEPGGRWMLKFGYDQALLDSIKSTFAGRQWDPNLRVWYIRGTYSRAQLLYWANLFDATLVWDPSCAARKSEAQTEAKQEPRNDPPPPREERGSWREGWRPSDYATWSQAKKDLWERLHESMNGGDRPPPPPRNRPASTNSAYHDMLSSLPPEVLKKVYRVIAGEIHPDRGGSERLMQIVNAAWERIKK